MPPTDDDTWRKAAEGWREDAQAFGAMYEELWRDFRRQVNTAIGLLSSEVIRLQKYIDKMTEEGAARRAADEADRIARQRRNDRFQWGIIVGLVALWVVNLLVLAYVAGGR